MQLERITIRGATISDFSEIRNQALAHSKADWILFVDTDEVVSRQLENEINTAIKSNNYSAYFLKRQDIFLSHRLKHGETGKAKFIRLARRDYGRWVRPVHEKWQGNGNVGELTSPLVHRSHTDLASFLRKIDRYSTLEANYRYSQGRRSSLFQIFFYPILKFKLNYIFRLGFLDGVPGLIMAIMMSFHSYLTWSKLYLLWHKK